MREVLTKTEKKIVKLAGLSPEDIKDKDIDVVGLVRSKEL